MHSVTIVEYIVYIPASTPDCANAKVMPDCENHPSQRGTQTPINNWVFPGTGQGLGKGTVGTGFLERLEELTRTSWGGAGREGQEKGLLRTAARGRGGGGWGGMLGGRGKHMSKRGKSVGAPVADKPFL